MTFSICVREEYTDDENTDHCRFGVAVTTRRPAVGRQCPFGSQNGAIATQSKTNIELGRKGIQYLDDGLSVTDALEALLNADENSPRRQLHGIDRNGAFTFTGSECGDWCGHTSGENFTVAGNLLAGESVIEKTAEQYESAKNDDALLATRLIDALEAGYEEGGDRRESLHVQSAALIIRSTETTERQEPYYNNLRVDATETPITDLRATCELALEDERMEIDY